MITVRYCFYRRGVRCEQIFTGTAAQWIEHESRLAPVTILSYNPTYDDRTAEAASVQPNPYTKLHKWTDATV